MSSDVEPLHLRLDPMVAAMLEDMYSQNPPLHADLGAEGLREAIKALAPDIEPTPLYKVENIKIPGPDCEIGARVYRPETGGPLPVLVYYHGGGWVLCDLDTHDEVCRRLALRARCAVISVDYRLAPEHPFPAGLGDSYAALEWVAANASGLNIDVSRIAVGGDSAGGNLAAVTAMLARDRNGPGIAHQFLVYPVTDVGSLETRSYADFKTGYYLERENMEWYRDLYVGADGNAADPLVSPLRAPDLAGLPPAYIGTAAFDVLRDEGKAYADALAAAGVAVTYECHAGMIHGFANMAATIPSADAALKAMASHLKNALWP